MTVYLDHNATTPLLPEVVDAMLPCLREHFGNPSSNHEHGRRAREAMERARGQVADLLGCTAAEVLFTSGGTEANNLAIRGVVEASGCRHVITTAIEHPATAMPCRYLSERGWRVDVVGVDGFGCVDVDDVRRLLHDGTDAPAFVTVMHSNNETGALQPVREIAEAAHEEGALIHTDAAQSIGKLAVDVNELGVDLLSVAGHKLHAPKGVGALYVRRGTPLRPFTLGAGHERGLRPGTENVASIVALGAACEIARTRLASGQIRLTEMRDRLWARLRDAVRGLVLHGHPTKRLPNTLNIRFPGVAGSAVLAATPEVAASTGSACHDGGEVASSVLLAMGIDPLDALGAVRLSVGTTTTVADVDAAADALARGYRRVCEGR